MAKAKSFEEFFPDPEEESAMNDADFESLLSASFAKESEVAELEQLEQGDSVSGQVVRSNQNEILVEIDQKNLGWVDPSEFNSSLLPEVGDTIKALYERYDDERGYAILSTSEVQKSVLWEDVEIGTIYEAVVTGYNTGGLTLEVCGERAFMPISQIELHYAEDLAPYVGRRLRAELTDFDRNSKNLVLSRKIILQNEFEQDKVKAVARFQVGDIVDGKITHIGPHGAFVDIGNFEALLHISKIRSNRKEIGSTNLLEGQKIRVQIARIDPEEGKIGLDFQQLTKGDWSEILKEYEEGDSFTTLIKTITADGYILALDDGVEGWAPLDPDRQFNSGSLVRCEITLLNQPLQRVELKIL